MGVTVFSLELAGLYQFSGKWQITGLFFLIAVFHGGARLGRKTYLVDMANQDNRATYVAVSNTLIGLFMLAGGRHWYRRRSIQRHHRDRPVGCYLSVGSPLLLANQGGKRYISRTDCPPSYQRPLITNSYKYLTTS